jgi:hypothetical protein
LYTSHSPIVLEIPKLDIKLTTTFETLGNDTLENKKTTTSANACNIKVLGL